MNALIGLERCFGWLLQTTWQAAVVAAIILVVQFLLRNRLSPAWRHGLWFLLVARLLMPMAPGSATSIFNLAKWPKQQLVQETPPTPPLAQLSSPVPVVFARPEKTEVQATTPSPASAAPVAGTMRAAALPTGPASLSAQPGNHPVDWMLLGASLWLGGVLVLALRFVSKERRFNSRLACENPTADEALEQLCRQCARSLRVREKVQVIETAEVDSPAVYGLRRKRLLLPVGLHEQLSVDELRHIFLHELAHIKRRDPELNWLLVLLQILHWFNPVLWFAFARIRADRELATDDLALAQARDRRSYGETILKVLEGLTPHRVLPGLVGIAESKAQIEGRIRAIARGGAAPRWRWAAAAAAVIIAGVALTNAREASQGKGINLLDRYPTTLKTGDTVPGRARPWKFTADDIFHVSGFNLEVGKQLRVETGVADLGIGHCPDGAVWAVLLPREDGKLTSTAAIKPEPIASVWLRFHPAEIIRLFPPENVTGIGSAELEERIRAIAQNKMTSSWQAGGRAMIPEPEDMTVDLDIRNGPRRFFDVNRIAQTAEYVAAFAEQTARRPAQPAYEPDLDTNCASVLSVVPPNGAKEVEPIQELRVVFDRRMNPYYVKLEWLAGGFQLNGSIQVGAEHKEFIIPVRLTPGEEHQLIVNRDRDREMWIATGRQPERKPSRSSRKGFLDADAVAANEFRWSFSTRAVVEKPGAAKPRVTKVSPASGATTPLLTFVEITFDQPMQSSDMLFPYLQKGAFDLGDGPGLIPDFDYDAAAHRFAFPVLLPPDNDARLILRGFYGANGMACDPVVLHYQTGADSLDPKYEEKARSAAKDASLAKLLNSMKEARARLNSGIITVQSIQMGMSKNAFQNIDAQTATFKWQGLDQVYADISGPMMSKAFILGCDGQTCWLYSEDGKGNKRLDQTPAAKTEKEITLVDPFSLAKRPVADALAEKGLVLASNAKLEGRSCYRVETWSVSQENMVSAIETQWWIDQGTSLPKQIVQHYAGGCQIVQFDYHELNQRIPNTAFQPPSAAGPDANPLHFGKEPGPGEQRFLLISDGSNGRMSGRIGFTGPNGRTSSGMN